MIIEDNNIQYIIYYIILIVIIKLARDLEAAGIKVVKDVTEDGKTKTVKIFFFLLLCGKKIINYY